MDMKAFYEEVEIEVIHFETEDIITTSDGGYEDEIVDDE